MKNGKCNGLDVYECPKSNQSTDIIYGQINLSSEEHVD